MAELPTVQSVRLSTGQKIAWREWGSGPPLIMLHGWSMSSVVFREVAENLAADFRVLCPDLPGHGDSEPVPLFELNPLVQALKQWAERLEVGNTALLGWSLGGQLALQMAAAELWPIEKLLLVATTPRFCQSTDWPHGLPKTQVRALQRNLGRAYEQTMGEFFKLQFADERMSQERYRTIIKFAVRSGRLPEHDVAETALQQLCNTDLRSLLSSIRQPAQVLHGAVDRIIPAAAGEYLARQLVNAQFVCLPAIGHAPFFSRPDECAELWRNFLQ